MPCTEYEEFIFPKCAKLEELWPCILTKALIKLYYFKVNHKSYIIDKIGDGGILYSLLGYVSEKIDIETNYSYISKCLPLIYKEEIFQSKHKIALALNSKQAFDNLKRLDIKKRLGDNSVSSCGSQLLESSINRSAKHRITAGSNPSSPIKLRTQLSSTIYI